MQRDSYLAPDALYLQSQNALEVIELENEKYETLKSDFQSNIVNSSEIGDVATSLKNYAEDFCMILDKAIEANDLDKADHETVENAVETIYADKVDIHENLDGAVILTNIETAQSKIQEIEDRISEIESMSLWDSTWHALFGSDSVSDLQSQKADWEKTLEDFQNKEKRYDSIESVTAGLFNTSEEVRELVWAGLEGIENSFLDGNYSFHINASWRIALEAYDMKRDYGYLYEYLANSNTSYSSEQIVRFIRLMEELHPAMLSSLDVLKNNSISSYDIQLSNISTMMEEYTTCIDNLTFIMETDWDESFLTSERMDELYYVLNKYDIKSREQICMFLSQCRWECDSGRGLIEYGNENYYNENGYGIKYRGSGCIHLTWKSNYEAFAAYLMLENVPQLKDLKTADKSYDSIVAQANELGVDVSYYTDIVNIGSDYVAMNFAWESAGYFWETGKFNSEIENGCSLDYVSRRINGPGCSTYEIREKYYTSTLQKYDIVMD